MGIPLAQEAQDIPDGQLPLLELGKKNFPQESILLIGYERRGTMASSQSESDRGGAGQRNSPRFFWKGTASIRILPRGPDVVGVLLDLSEGGCGVELGMALPADVGAMVEVGLRVHDLTLKQRGILRNIRFIRHVEKETRAGIEFSDGNSRGSEQFRLLIKQLLAQVEKDPSNDAKEKSAQGWWARLFGSGR